MFDIGNIRISVKSTTQNYAELKNFAPLKWKFRPPVPRFVLIF